MADIGASNWNEADASNSTAAPDGWPEGMAPSGVNDSGRAVMGAVKRFYDWQSTKLTGGTSTAYTLAYSVAPGALVDGMTHLVQFNATNGAAATLNVGALGAKPLYTYQPAGWAAAPAGVITANMITPVTYDAGASVYRVREVAAAGTWTPIDSSGAGLSFSAVSGNYQVLGNMVFAYFALTFPATASGAGVTIGGLPLTVPNLVYAQLASPIISNGPTAGFVSRPTQNTTQFIIINQNGPNQSTNSGFSTLFLSGCVMYPAA